MAAQIFDFFRYLTSFGFRGEPMSDQYKFTFGKYKGRFINEVPNHYIVWLHEQKPREPLYSILAVELSRRYALPDPEERKRVQEAIKKFCESL